ncbi:prolactin receptor a [Morone saxatilis]|uniref:prolactin receptor a n=1 Tax=Morone saxatilis TaxID=34816 RepID=UPI0015E202CF|nr:prolactin receptor a [Morone saxatilis]XP_035524016.1 prolactin receptor a [Morone saxatilis]XP_035524017.1 prolactin receptor a [Morone saxatilis]
MKKVVEVILLLLLLVFTPHAKGTGNSPPGKPTLTRCRSPEKETFTCWWEPGSDGGLPTTFALYYRKETSETVYECPDYHTAGKNSCFFNKNDTSIWVNYNITVVATNALGSTFSDPVDIDVVYIVKPNPPERVTVIVLEDKSWPFLRVSWEPPHKADTRSGWITLVYQIRVKLEQEKDWEMHHAGQQKMFNIFSLRSGGTYLVQVRCKPDHGFWSEWSSTSYVKVPDYFHREKSVWILIAVFSAFIFLILTWLLHMNSRSLKHCILPPVPGPKIKGFDKQLLKNGKSEEIFSALVVCDFPPTTSSNYEDLLVEYLEVYVPEEQELMLEESKDLHDGCLKSESSTSDSDSGRGSCDSHTLLMDKCGEAKEEERHTDQERMGTEAEDMVSPDMSSGRVKTWPSVFSPLPQYSSNTLDEQSSLEMAKQHYLSDSLFLPSSTSSYLTQPGHGTKEALGPSYWEFCLSNKQPHLLHPQTQARQQLQAHSDVNISSIGRKEAPACLQSPLLRPTEYVEVQRVNEDIVLLQPVVSGCGQNNCSPQMPQGKDYSKVKGVDSDNKLLLQREIMEEDRCPCEHQETNGVRENCYMSSAVTTTQKPTAMLVQDEMVLGVNGYVDTATMCTPPTY